MDSIISQNNHATFEVFIHHILPYFQYETLQKISSVNQEIYMYTRKTYVSNMNEVMPSKFYKHHHNLTALKLYDKSINLAHTLKHLHKPELLKKLNVDEIAHTSSRNKKIKQKNEKTDDECSSEDSDINYREFNNYVEDINEYLEDNYSDCMDRFHNLEVYICAISSHIFHPSYSSKSLKHFEYHDTYYGDNITLRDRDIKYFKNLEYLVVKCKEDFTDKGFKKLWKLKHLDIYYGWDLTKKTFRNLINLTHLSIKYPKDNTEKWRECISTNEKYMESESEDLEESDDLKDSEEDSGSEKSEEDNN